jgi:multiple sugar transport system permease protein
VKHARQFRPAIQGLARSAVLYGLLVGFSSLFLLPVLWMISASLQGQQGVFASPYAWIPASPRWENYATVTTMFPFWRYLANTLVITLSVTTATLLSCSLVAYGFARLRFPGRDFLFALCLATMMLPGQVTMIPLYVMFARMGWVDTFLPLIVPALFGTPFYIFLLRQFFLTIPREYDEAARIDGAGHLRIYWSIVMPLARPALATVALFTFVGAWNDFFGPLVYINSPQNATLTLGLNMLKAQITGTGLVQWQVLMAGALLVMLPNVAVFLLSQKHFVKGLAVGGLRG